jgi:predicted PurR-regulated permease PerM
MSIIEPPSLPEDYPAPTNDTRPAPTPVTPWIKSALIGLTIVILGAGLLWAVWVMGRPIALFLLSMTIAAALAPAVNFLERWLRRTAAIIFVYLLLITVLLLIGLIVIPPLNEQVQDVTERAPLLLNRAEAWLNEWLEIGDTNLREVLVAQVEGLSMSAVAIPLGILSSLFEIILILFISLYLLIEAPAIERFILSLFPRTEAEQARTVMHEMATAMGGYVRGTLLSGLAVGIIGYLGLLIIGVANPLPLAVLAAALEIFPYLGPAIAAVPIIGLAFLQSPSTGITVAIFWLALQQIESNVLLPNIMRSQTEISPLLVLLALAGGYAVGGILGAIVAIPVTAALRVFIMMVLAPAIRRRTGAAAEAAEKVRVEKEAEL